MSDHFSKYGNIRFIQPREASNEAASQAVVVFWVCLLSTDRINTDDQSIESVEACMSDPERHDCISRSYPTSSRFNIGIEEFPCQTSTVYIKLSGPRCDHRARSASPPSRTSQTGTIGDTYLDLRPMPPFITIWGMPEANRRTARIEWRAYIVLGEEPPEMERRQAMTETGSEPTFIERIELNRRIPQKVVSFRASSTCFVKADSRSYKNYAISSLKS